MEQKAESRRKTSQGAAAGGSADAQLYLILEGPARTVWTMSTAANGTMISLVPVCSSEESAIDLVRSLQSRAYQYAEVSLSRIQTMFEGEETRFILDPEMEERGGVLIFREELNWGITVEELGSMSSSVGRTRQK